MAGFGRMAERNEQVGLGDGEGSALVDRLQGTVEERGHLLDEAHDLHGGGVEPRIVTDPVVADTIGMGLHQHSFVNQ